MVHFLVQTCYRCTVFLVAINQDRVFGGSTGDSCCSYSFVEFSQGRASSEDVVVGYRPVSRREIGLFFICSRVLKSIT